MRACLHACLHAFMLACCLCFLLLVLMYCAIALFYYVHCFSLLRAVLIFCLLVSFLFLSLLNEYVGCWLGSVVTGSGHVGNSLVNRSASCCSVIVVFIQFPSCVYAHDVFAPVVPCRIILREALLLEHVGSSNHTVCLELFWIGAG